MSVVGESAWVHRCRCYMVTCAFLCVPGAHWSCGTALSSFPTIFVPRGPTMTSGQRYRQRPHREVTGSLPVCQDSAPAWSAKLSLWSLCFNLAGYVYLFQAMWIMLQQDEPDDFVIATGEVHSVREFVEMAFKHIGKTIVWVHNPNLKKIIFRLFYRQLLLHKNQMDLLAFL